MSKFTSSSLQVKQSQFIAKLIQLFPTRLQSQGHHRAQFSSLILEQGRFVSVCLLNERKDTWFVRLTVK